MNDHLLKYLIIVLSFLLSMLLASLFVRKGIPLLKKPGAEAVKSRGNWTKDIGFWIGFFEHVIIFIFVLNKEFSALAIIFGAKEFVRKKAIEDDPAYFLLGTLINFGVALVMVEIAKELFKMIC